MAVTQITQLSEAQKARIPEWIDHWIEVGLRTGPADRERFKAAVRDCYRFAGLRYPEVVVWVPSPLVMALAAPVAAATIEQLDAAGESTDATDLEVRGAVRGIVDCAMSQMVGSTLQDAIQHAVGTAVQDRVGGLAGNAVHHAVHSFFFGAGGAVHDAIDRAVGRAVHGSVDTVIRLQVDGRSDDMVGGAVRKAVGTLVDRADSDVIDWPAVHGTIRRTWDCYIGGQFWAGGSPSPALTSFFREVCELDLKGDLWDRARAYEATAESACWWWPHRCFVMACERPTELHLEQSPPHTPRFQPHRLHREDGPAIAWSDGWGVWALHGVQVTRQIVEAPETLTVQQIRDERNTEVRRIMLERFGVERFLQQSEATRVAEDVWGRLWSIPNAPDEVRGVPMQVVEMVNSTPDPDGTHRTYFERVPPGVRTPLEGLAWQAGVDPAVYADMVEQS